MNSFLLEVLNGSLAWEYSIAFAVFFLFVIKRRASLMQPVFWGGLSIALTFLGETARHSELWWQRFSINHGPVALSTDDMALLAGGATVSIGLVGVAYIFAGASGMEEHNNWKLALLTAASWPVFFALAYYI